MKRLALVAALALALTAAPADGGCSRRCKQRVVRPHKAWLTRVAWCESRHRWHLSTGNGFFGGLQFTLSSWRGVGGRGYPHRASRLEQMYRGVLLLRAQGPSAWPVCSR